MAAKEIARYEAEGGQQVTLTFANVREVISTSPNVTDKEVMLFAAKCKAHRLNPFIGEAYLIKYGDNAATIVVSKDVFVKRAARNPRFKGYEAGLSLQTADGRFVRRGGSMALPGEVIVGAWCRVYIDGYEVPIFDEVSFDEYAGRRRDGSLTGQWKGKPGTMIRKVALVHALREAFPEDFAGLYESAEMGVEEPRLEEPTAPAQPAEAPQEPPIDVEPQDAGSAPAYEWETEMEPEYGTEEF